MSHHLRDYVTLTLRQGRGGEGQALIQALRSRGFVWLVASGDLKHEGKSRAAPGVEMEGPVVGMRVP